MLRAVSIFILAIMALDVSAQTSFVKYKSYLIPVPTGYTPCADSKPRILISTDLNGFNTDADPDDIQSMVHLLSLSNQLVIRGLISTPNVADPGVTLEKEHIKNIIDAYGADYSSSLQSQGYPPPSELDAVVRQGNLSTSHINNIVYNPENDDRDQGAKLIIDEAQAVLNRQKCGPLYVLVWGTIVDLAVALKESEAKGLGIEKAIRVYFIASSNKGSPSSARFAAYNYIKTNFLDSDRLWFVESGFASSNETFRGMWANTEQERLNFLNSVSNPTTGSGSTNQSCLSYVLRKSADKIQSNSNQAGLWVKAGDTPSLLHVLDPSWNLSNGYPSSSNWGGQYKLSPGKQRWWIDDVGTSSIAQHLNGGIYPDWKAGMDNFSASLPSNCISTISPTIN
jgi:hypothetical protein